MQLFKAKQCALSDTALSSSEHLAKGLSRRQFGLTAAAALAMPTALRAHGSPKITSKGTYDITVDRVRIDTGNFRKMGVGYNKSQIPTILRFKEGEEVTINVTNNLRESTSIHWHGLILPFQQDGVPGISFNGIAPGETFTYRFPIQQAGTYWFHSHSGFQEPDGAYGAIVIEPRDGERIRTDRDYVVQLADKHPHPGSRIMRNLKRMPDYYNRSQRTLQTLIEDSRQDSLKAALKDRGMWGRMRMMPTDIEDVQGFTALINGRSTSQNWTGLFRPGEKVRLRIVNSSAMTYFDMRIPGLKMTVVQADGNDVKPVTVDELRVAVAETYDVIVQPRENKVYSIIAESMGRTALVRGTLSPREGYAGAVPPLRPKPLLTMADMSGMMGGMDMGDHVMQNAGGMQDMTGMDHSAMQGMDHSNMGSATAPAAQAMDNSTMKGMDHSKMEMSAQPAMKGMDHSGMAMSDGGDPFYAPGSGLTPKAYNGGKFLSYKDLRAARPLYRNRAPSRTIELRLTGNMERYIWSINGVKYDDADPIVLNYGERVRIRFINETMMAHPMHLHGMWSIVDTGQGARNPIKHTVSVQPGTTTDMEVEVDAPGQWAFHCHLSYHADGGMFRKVVVRGRPA
ncbi:CopA family copper-resistance protein [Roseovarius halotolerans]|jgi:L-ascorbate oxidase|uniref:Copper resistance protein A n=2 Tax=Pseudomonadota TaxID=1224 RepID=A0A1X6ZBE5_9RHOB|nr:copper resistance system multicopper oxidase [Roseovarius halotolerans]MAU54175.1 copper oxidase [Roseovarius sp.]RKT30578.1 CopA family copper-resistance protein [Roseovarius halotolerans]SLN46257.1 Copper resistance protein A precursor [Roseovarius halotolerans]|tara:strand:- start:7945 stop:9816 length:1872 start_codon:yes stop_codon:yes gene_type:complete